MLTIFVAIIFLLLICAVSICCCCRICKKIQKSPKKLSEQNTEEDERRPNTNVQKLGGRRLGPVSPRNDYRMQDSCDYNSQSSQIDLTDIALNIPVDSVLQNKDVDKPKFFESFDLEQDKSIGFDKMEQEKEEISPELVMGPRNVK